METGWPSHARRAGRGGLSGWPHEAASGPTQLSALLLLEGILINRLITFLLDGVHVDRGVLSHNRRVKGYCLAPIEIRVQIP